MSSATPPRIGRVMSMQSDEPRDALEPIESADMYDALRDLFLGGEEPPATSSATAPINQPADAPGLEPAFPRIEALVLGHLPVQQSAWVMQYAKDAASQRGGPVGLLRIREGEATLDMVGMTAGPAGGPTATIEDAIRAIGPAIKSLIVRVDATSEPLLPRLESIDAITLLTGADEAAIVGSYRTVKGLMGDASDNGPRLRLAIMGASTDKALAAADKIQKAVQSHLNAAIEVTACLARIGVGKSVLIHRGLMTGDVETLLSSIRELLARPAPSPSPAAAPPPAPDSVEDPTFEPAHIDWEPPPAPVMSRLGQASPAAARVERTPEAVESVGPKSLASHVSGLTPVPISCPFQPGVEFAIDRQGGMHLLARSVSAKDAWPAVGSLLAAAQWTKHHSSLITLAVERSNPAIDTRRTPALHLLSAEAKGALALVDVGIQPHLLVEVTVDGKSGWYCTELA